MRILAASILCLLITACAPQSPPPAATVAAPLAQPASPAGTAPSSPPVASPAGTVPSSPPAASPAAASSPAAAGSLAAAPSPTPAAAGPGAAASPATTGPRAKLTVAYSNNVPHFLPLWIAKDAGIFDQYNLDVDVQLISGGQVLMASIVAGQTPIGVLGGSEGVSASVAGADVKIVGNLVPVSVWQLYVPGSITNADMLRGGKVAIVTVGGSADIATRIMLSKIGLSPNDVAIVTTGSTENQASALVSGAVQGGAFFPPYSTTFDRQGFHPLVDLAALHQPSADTCIEVQGEYLRTNREVVQRFVDAIIQAIARERSDRDYSIAELQKHMNIDDQQALGDAYQRFALEVVQPLPDVTAGQFGDVITALSASNERVQSFDVNSILDRSLIQDAAAAGLGR